MKALAAAGEKFAVIYADPPREFKVYRGKGKRAQQAAVVAYACATFERAEAFAAALARDLARCAALECESMAILAELAALTVGGSWQASSERMSGPI